jgi:hypothetical protein
MSVAMTQKLVQTWAPEPLTEQRAAPRYRYGKLVRVRRLSVPPAAFRLSLVQDASAQGIGLLLTQALPPGTLLEVEVSCGSAAPWVARVVHATKHEGGWLIGCAFNHSLTDAELARLRS